MKKILKFGLGVIALATAAHVTYHGYKSMEENLLHDLTDAARAFFSSEQVDAVWIFEDPSHGAIFEGGIISGAKAIVFEIDAETLEILEKSEEMI